MTTDHTYLTPEERARYAKLRPSPELQRILFDLEHLERELAEARETLERHPDTKGMMKMKIADCIATLQHWNDLARQQPVPPVESVDSARRDQEKLSTRLSGYLCNKCGYLGKEGPRHSGCNYNAYRDRVYQMAVDLEAQISSQAETIAADKKLLDDIASALLNKQGDGWTYVPCTLAAEIRAMREQRDSQGETIARLEKELANWKEEFGTDNPEVALLDATNHGAKMMTEKIADFNSGGVLGHAPAQAIRDLLKEKAETIRRLREAWRKRQNKGHFGECQSRHGQLACDCGWYEATEALGKTSSKPGEGV